MLLIYIYGPGLGLKNYSGEGNSGRLFHHKVEAKLYNSLEYHRKKTPSVPIEWEVIKAKNPLVPAPSTVKPRFSSRRRMAVKPPERVQRATRTDPVWMVKEAPRQMTRTITVKY